jgi:hypothetical protein
MVQNECFNLDKEAATQAIKIVGEVFIQAGKEAEEQGKKEGKTGPELDKMKQDVQQKWIETLERLVTKTLGVLQEQGVYAMLLFLFSRTGDEKKVAPVIRMQLYEILKRLPNFNNLKIEDDSRIALDIYTKDILNNIDILLLVRDLYEQTLIYARYAAKAEKKGG